MRLTLEPTTEGTRQHKIIIESPGDDQDIMDMRDLLRYMLLAWGFAIESIDELLPLE